MTTVKKKKQNEAEAYLSISDPRTGVKPWSERKKYHDSLLAERPAKIAGGDVVYTDDEKAAARDLLKRSGIDADSIMALDHCFMHQDRSLRTAAERLGGSAERYTAREQFYASRKNLNAAAERRHTDQGLIAYKKIHTNLKAYAARLEALGGEKVTWPAVLPSDAEVRYT